MANIALQIPNSTDNDTVWLAWYNSMRSGFLGWKKANEEFLLAWSKLQPTNANTNTLRTEMAKHGVTITSGSWLGSVEDSALSGLKEAGTIGELMIAIPVIFAFAAVGMIIYGMAKGAISANINTIKV